MAGWVITLIGSVAVYVFLMTYLFPQILLKTGLIIPTPRDRGIKNIKETTGRTIVYQPAIEYRKYIPQYLISERNGKKILLCKVSPNVKYIDYDVVMYDGTNQVCKVVNAKELIEDDMYTDKMPLGANVAYVSIIINAVNNGKPAEKKRKPITTAKIAWYLVACIATTVLEILLIKLCCSCLFGGVFRETFMAKGNSIWTTILFTVLATAANVTFVMWAVKKNNRR